MANFTCPQCGKTGPADDGYCTFCGYTFDESPKGLNSAFSGGASVQAESGRESYVIRPDANFNADSFTTNKSSELMFGFGFCRLFAIFAALLIGLSPLFTYYKLTAPNGDYKISLITGTIGIVMLVAAAFAIFFAVKGKPAIYLLFAIGELAIMIRNLLYSNVAESMSRAAFAALKVETGLVNSDAIPQLVYGPGYYVMIVGGLAMMLAAIIFVMNHQAYDD